MVFRLKILRCENKKKKKKPGEGEDGDGSIIAYIKVINDAENNLCFPRPADKVSVNFRY